MRRFLMIALLFVFVLSGRVFADCAYEFSWRVADVNYEVLLIVPADSNIAVGKVRMTSYYNGSLLGFAEERFRMEFVSDGIIFWGFNAPWDYVPDNFLLHDSGEAYMIDELGNISPMRIRQIYSSELRRIVQKYQI